MEKKLIEQTDFQLSKDKKLGRLLRCVVAEVSSYAQEQIKHIKKLSEIGMALSVEKNMNRLFEMIVDEARSFCLAEAGTLYLFDKKNQSLKFEVLQNEAMNTRMGGFNGESIKMANVPLYRNGKPNHSNVSSHVALTGATVNLPDIYDLGDTKESQGLDFTGTMNYDRTTGYRTRSMLVVPMTNHDKDIIGVLQLINARDEETGKVVPFSEEYVDIVSSLASQAAVALTNAQLIRELKDLFYSFIRSIATAIDEKSAYTGGHIRRVVELAMMIADDINDSKTGVFKDTRLNQAQIEELHIAAWMHDVGKITTPEYIVDKSTKLETIFDRLELVETRFALIEQLVENKYQDRKLRLMASGDHTPTSFKQLEEECRKEISEIRDDFQHIQSSNHTGEYMSDEELEKIKAIGRKTYLLKGRELPFLSEDEIYNLCIRKGTLTDEERAVIENHAKMTFDITSQLPFPKTMAKVPEYAASHHEKLDGSGYPAGKSGDALPLQSRIIAVADIFEALTARDRPYKRTMNLSEAIGILNFMKKDNHLDADILDLFSENKTYLKYAKKEMSPEQIDME